MTLKRVTSGLAFPLHSAADVVNHFGGRDGSVQIKRQTVYPARLLSEIPPYYFPISSVSDLVDKVAYLKREKLAARALAATPGTESFALRLERLRAQLPPLSFPIESEGDLLEAFEKDGPYRIGGRTVTAKQITEAVAGANYPIRSVDALLEIAASLWAGAGKARAVRLSPNRASRQSGSRTTKRHGGS